MDWFAPLDGYCERTHPGLLAEPFNAISNIAFLIAAILVLRLALRRPPDGPVVALAILVGVIGIGSALFHTFANRLTLVADVAPITLFIYAYFFLAMRRILGLGAVAALALTVIFLLASLGVESLVRPFLGGSAGYVPALVAILAVAAAAWPREPEAAGLLLFAGAAFAVSLTLRTLDLPLCETFPRGTHFLWHALNALVLATLLVAALGTRREPA